MAPIQTGCLRQPRGTLWPVGGSCRSGPRLRLSLIRESGLMTGATINFDQSVWGAYEDSPHPRVAMTV